MDYTQTLTYLLYGVAGLGALLALVVLIMAVFPPKLDEYENDSDEDKLDDSPFVEYDNFSDAQDYAESEREEMLAEENPVTEDFMKDETDEPFLGEEFFEENDFDDVIELPEPRDAIDAPPRTRYEPEKPTVIGLPPNMQNDPPALEKPEAAKDSELSDTASIPVQDGALRIGDFTIRTSVAQDIGARAEQQDAYEIGPCDAESLKKNGFLCVLCDGMGGMKMGGDAAQVAAKSFVKECYKSDLPTHQAMMDAVRVANDRVWALCRTDDLSGAGSTLVSACIDPAGLSFVSVGDSHIYLYRSGVLSQLNIDHNYLTELLLRVRQGEISRQEALSDPEKSHLTSYLGVRALSLIDRSGEPLTLESGDVILLASDGLFKVMTQKEISAHLNTFDPKCANRLVDDVLRRRFRNQDNVSVIIISVQ